MNLAYGAIYKILIEDIDWLARFTLTTFATYCFKRIFLKTIFSL